MVDVSTRGDVKFRDLSLRDATLISNVSSDANLSRTVTMKMLGQKGDNSATTMASILAQHDGGGADEKARVSFRVNDAVTPDTPVEMMSINSAGLVSVVNAFDVNGATTLNQVTIDTTDGNFNVNGANNVSMTSTSGAPGAVTIDVNGGISEKIHMQAHQGTGNDAIHMQAISGGITLASGGGKAITLQGDVTITGTLTGGSASAEANITILNPGAVTPGYDTGTMGQRHEENVTQDTAQESGTAQGGTTTSITLAAGANAQNDFYKGWYVKCTNDSPAGMLNMKRVITGYDGTTKVATVAAWGPDSPTVTTTYSLYPNVYTGVIWDESAGELVAASIAESFLDGQATIQSKLGFRVGAFDAEGGATFATTLNVDGAATLDQTTINTTDGMFQVEGSGQVNMNHSGGTVINGTGSTSVTCTGDIVESIKFSANGGTGEKVTIESIQGNGADAIFLRAQAGGITLNGNSAVVVTNGMTVGTTLDVDGACTFDQVTIDTTDGDFAISGANAATIVSTKNAADAILLHANGGINETIKLHADQGTDAASINIVSDAGGITLNAASDVTVTNNMVVSGNFTVNGTTTTVNSTTLAVEDKNIELGDVTTPTDNTAGGGGITLKGATDKTIVWTQANASWDFSEHVNAASGKEFRIANTKVLDATEIVLDNAGGNGIVYLGPSGSDNTWRMTVVGTSLSFQRRETGTWVTKFDVGV
jgi:hypothetical protein